MYLPADGFCVINALFGKFESLNDRVRIYTDGSQGGAWLLGGQSGGSQSIEARAMCASWQLFRGNVPQIHFSGSWNLTAIGPSGTPGAAFSTTLWGTDSYCHLRSVGGRSGTGFLSTYAIVDFGQTSPFQLQVSAAGGFSSFAEAGCESFSAPGNTVHPAIQNSDYVDDKVHSVPNPSPATALCGILEYYGSMTSDNAEIYISTADNSLNNFTDNGQWPVSRATCLNYVVPF
jgi:hypothetical protein